MLKLINFFDIKSNANLVAKKSSEINGKHTKGVIPSIQKYIYFIKN